MRLPAEKIVIALLLAVLGGSLALGAVLAADNGFSLESLGYPRCLMLQAAGKPCPLCGGVSAFGAFMRGDLATAWSANPFGALLIPTLAIITFGLTVALVWPGSIRPLIRGRRFVSVIWGWGAALLLVLVLSWIARLLL